MTLLLVVTLTCQHIMVETLPVTRACSVPLTAFLETGYRDVYKWQRLVVKRCSQLRVFAFT